MNRLALAAGLVFLLAQSAPAAAQTPLAAAKNLYLTAAYDDALAALDRMKQAGPSPSDAREIELYRAFCLLALKRQTEAAGAIEALVALDPLFRPQEGDASPWVREAFQATRRRILPSAAQRQYQSARAAFGRKEYAQAAAGFRLVLAILKDPDLGPGGAEPKLADLAELAQGYLDLSQAASDQIPGRSPAQTPPQAPPQTAPPQIPAQPSPQTPAQAVPQVSAEAPAPQPSAAQPAGTEPPKTTTGAADRAGAPASGRPAPAGTTPPAGTGAAASPIYTSSDSGVTPPIPIYQQLPRWSSDIKNYKPGAVGLLETVIDETGQVTSAVMRQSVHPVYDVLVVSSARTWLYKPATKDGRAVKFRRVIEVLGPTKPPEARLPGLVSEPAARAFGPALAGKNAAPHRS